MHAREAHPWHRDDHGRDETALMASLIGPSTQPIKSDVAVSLDRNVFPAEGYALTVLVLDVADTVRNAGGWICDRARAGWRVSAFVFDDEDETPLHVLGVRTQRLTDDQPLSISNPLAFALAASALDRELLGRRNRSDLLEAVRLKTTEVTIWGAGPVDCGRRFGNVEHRLSSAAKAFKVRAMEMARTSAPACVETLHRSGGMWHPLP
jgi:hypothetical protein